MARLKKRNVLEGREGSKQKIDGKTAIYLRVSSETQVKDGNGLDSQRFIVLNYCNARGWLVSAEMEFVDAGISGTHDDRKAFQDMLRRADSGEITRIVTGSLDRIARNTRNLLDTVERLNRNGVELVMIKENIDTSGAVGKFFVSVMGALAELEATTIKERMTNGRIANAKKGRYNGSRIPYGYNFADGRFTINNDDAFQIRSMFSLYNKGVSMHSIAGMMNSSGAKTRDGNLWYASTIRYILRNGAYAGLTQWNGEESAGVVYPQIISLSIYETAQEKLSRAKRGNPNFGKQTVS